MRELCDEVFVQRLTRDHGQGLCTQGKSGCNAEVQLSMIANDLAKRLVITELFRVWILAFVKKIRVREAGWSERPAAKRYDLGPVPGAYLAPTPLAVSLSQARQ